MSIALTRRLSRYPKNLGSQSPMTTGLRMQTYAHQQNPRDLILFCEPFTATNGYVENTIGLVRRFAKENQLANISQDHLQKSKLLNKRPENVLDLKPAEIFNPRCCT